MCVFGFPGAGEGRIGCPVTFTGDRITACARTASSSSSTTPRPTTPRWIGTLQQNGVTFSAAPPERQSFLMQLFISSFPILLLIGVWVYFMRQMQGGAGARGPCPSARAAPGS